MCGPIFDDSNESQEQTAANRSYQASRGYNWQAEEGQSAYVPAESTPARFAATPPQPLVNA